MRFAADENFDGRILKALRERIPDIDVVRVQDTEMYGAADPKLLEWLAGEKRILLTHDVKTMPGFVFARVKAGKWVPGVVEVRRSTPLGDAIEELELMIGAGTSADFADQVRYIPIR